VIVWREQLEAVGGFDESLGYACDYATWMKLCVEGRVGFVHEALVRYRWHAGNASRQYQYTRGVEECGQAMRAAVAYYQERTGEVSQAKLLAEAVEAVLESRQWAAELDQGRTWLEGQLSRWQELAQERAQLLSEQLEWIDERETVIREQQEWTETLEQGKRWLEEQRASWQHTAEEREQTIVEQQAWIEELESGKRWLEEHRSNWQAQAAHWHERLWGRLGLRLGLLKPAQEFSLHPQSQIQNNAAKNDLE
jgi:chromosome segregation ATPase